MFRRGSLLLLAMLLTLGIFATGRAAPVAQIGPAPFAFPTNATVLSSANVRVGPGTDYAIISSARAGQTVSIIGCNIDCSWYKLAEDCWIAAFLVKPELPPTPIPTVGVVYIPTIVVNGAVIVPSGIPQATRCPQTNAQVSTYAGPSIFYPVVDTRPANECVAVIGRNTIGDWFQLSHGMWLQASAVIYAEPIETMPNTEPTATPTLTPLPTETPLPGSQPPTPTPGISQSGQSFNSSGGSSQPFTCVGGCAVATNGCNIKGNADSGIYHTTSSRYYDRTDVDPSDGDVWFCTEDEARAAGYRPPEN